MINDSSVTPKVRKLMVDDLVLKYRELTQEENDPYDAELLWIFRKI